MLPEGFFLDPGGHFDESQCEVGIHERDVCSASQDKREESERGDSTVRSKFHLTEGRIQPPATSRRGYLRLNTLMLTANSVLHSG